MSESDSKNPLAFGRRILLSRRHIDVVTVPDLSPLTPATLRTALINSLISAPSIAAAVRFLFKGVSERSVERRKQKLRERIRELQEFSSSLANQQDEIGFAARVREETRNELGATLEQLRRLSDPRLCRSPERKALLLFVPSSRLGWLVHMAFYIQCGFIIWIYGQVAYTILQNPQVLSMLPKESFLLLLYLLPVYGIWVSYTVLVANFIDSQVNGQTIPPWRQLLLLYRPATDATAWLHVLVYTASSVSFGIWLTSMTSVRYVLNGADGFSIASSDRFATFSYLCLALIAIRADAIWRPGVRSTFGSEPSSTGFAGSMRSTVSLSLGMTLLIVAFAWWPGLNRVLRDGSSFAIAVAGTIIVRQLEKWPDRREAPRYIRALMLAQPSHPAAWILQFVWYFSTAVGTYQLLTDFSGLTLGLAVLAYLAHRWAAALNKHADEVDRVPVAQTSSGS